MGIPQKFEIVFGIYEAKREKEEERERLGDDIEHSSQCYIISFPYYSTKQ